MIIAAAAFENKTVFGNACEAFNIIQTDPPAFVAASCENHYVA